MAYPGVAALPARKWILVSLTTSELRINNPESSLSDIIFRLSRMLDLRIVAVRLESSQSYCYRCKTLGS